MSEPKNKVEVQRQENRFLKRIIIVFFVIIIFLGIGIYRIPTNIVVYTAPDVTKAFSQKSGSVPPNAVYSFARILWESINYCEEDCGKEYPEKLDKYSIYLTKSCKRQLKNHFSKNKELYSYRSRLLLPTDNTMFTQDRIRQMSSDSWFVKLEYNLKDDVKGHVTRDNIMMYPLNVIKSNKPLTVNPIGLEVDCYFGDGPVLLKKKEV